MNKSKIFVLSDLNEIREQQKLSWNKFSAGWKKWDTLTMDFLQPAGQAIINHITPSGNQNILDVAGGTGEPGLTIASMLNGGSVFITDLSEAMLLITNENAILRNISNIKTKSCDVCELPFENDLFDSISCRFGFMFFPDMQFAANEMYRVLKSGGKIATTVWNIPEKNFWVTAIMGTIMKHIEIPPNPSGAPGMFRCSSPGMMTEIFKTAGFKNVNEKEIPLSLNCGTTQRYWEMMTEVGAPIVAALSSADIALQEKIKNEVIQLITSKYPGENITLDASSILITAEK